LIECACRVARPAAGSAVEWWNEPDVANLKRRTIIMLGKTLSCAGAFLVALIAVPCAAADGDPDPGFGSSGIAYVTPDDVDAREIMPNAAIALPDGKLLFGGARNKLIEGAPPYEPQIRGMLVRLDADGSPDATFGNTTIPGLFELPDLVAGTRMQSVESMARLDDGSIIAVGTGMVNSPQEGFIVKLDAAGALDTAFGTGGSVLLPKFYPHAVALDSQGRAVVAGERFDNQSFVYTSTVLRLTADGAPDATFGSAGEVAIAWSDAMLSGYLNSVAITPDGQLVVAGSFEAYGAGFGSDFAIARLDAAGAFDTGFAGTGWRVFHDPSEASTSNRIDRLALQSGGRIAFAGFHTSGENMTGLILGRLGADGTTDMAFGDAASPGFLKPAVLPTAQTVNVTALVAQADDKLIVSAAYFAAPDKEDFFALRTTADGQLDAGFALGGVFDFDAAPGSGVYSEISAMTLQPDGRIVVAGRSMRSDASPVVDMAAMRLLNATTPADRVFADGFD
jgi:uncharacterized delta-60 repeat protein